MNYTVEYIAEDISALFASRGGLVYEGEGVSQIEHAWQCGQLAKRAGASLELQLASWLHDLGHLLTHSEGTPTLDAIDDRHEHTGAHVIHALWGPAVSEPVRLHVHAKRFFVATKPGYAESLSPDSVRSLALQGGPMTIQECVHFQRNPHALDAQQLRCWDDLGKQPGWFAQDTQHALDELETLMQRVTSTSF